MKKSCGTFINIIDYRWLSWVSWWNLFQNNIYVCVHFDIFPDSIVTQIQFSLNLSES